MRAWQVITMALLLLLPIRVAFAQDAAASKLALVIGNSKYPEGALANASADAGAVAAELRRQGFAVDLAEDANQTDLVQRSENLLKAVKPGTTVFVYFNGYAIQSGRQNYLIPVDGNVWTETDVQKFGLGLVQLVGEIARRGATDIYVVVEGAARNPYERRFRNYSTGLASVATLPTGTTLMLSAPPGAVLRPPTGPRGPLAGELVGQLAAAGRPSPAVFEKTRAAVASATPEAPSPWILASRAEPKPTETKPADTVKTTPDPVIKTQEPVVTQTPPPTPPKADEGRTETTKNTDQPTDRPPVEGGPKGGQTTASRPDTAPTTGREGERKPPETPPPPPPKPRIAQLPYAPADERALRDLDAAIARNPDDAAALYTRGQTYAVHYDFAKALSDFDRVLTLNPSDVEALNNRCWIKAIIDDLDAAIADCNAALRLRPEFLDALDSRGFVMLKIGLPRRAIGDYDAALKINPKHASALYGRGLARQRLGEKVPGERDVKLALSIDPKVGEQFSLFGIK